MITFNIYFFIILFFLLAGYILETVAARLNLRALSADIPSELKDYWDEERYRKSQEYTRANLKLGMISSSVNLLLLLCFITVGGFFWLDLLVKSFNLPQLWTGLLFIAVLFLAADILGMPLEIYRIFVLEEKFGFNRMGWATFIADKLKGYALMFILGLPIVAGVMIFFKTYAFWGWFYAWVFMAAVMLFIQYIAPTLIMPLFNKFTPLKDEELKQKIWDYAQRVGFDLSGIYVMDGSKRSSKSNAFFTGLGSKKRIALFDTLIDKHDSNELLAVLAHEIGHYKLRHVVKNLVLSLIKTAVLLFVMSLFLTHKPLFEAFGMQSTPIYAGLVFFVILYSPVALMLSVFSNMLSRKYEYKADAFASRTTGHPEFLIRALKKLSADNLSNLNPHWFYVFLQYSHPPVLKRIRALQAKQTA